MTMNIVKGLFNTIWQTASEMASPVLETHGPYNPTPTDTITVRSILHSLGLPVELTLAIVDMAEYYPKIQGYNGVKRNVSASQGVRNCAATLYVVSDPIPEVKDGERMNITGVKFKIRSHDQGWGGDDGCRGTYRGSWTWFEAAILRHDSGASLNASPPSLPSLPYDTHPEPTSTSLAEFGYALVPCTSSATDQPPVTWRIQANVCAKSEEREHEVEWHKDVIEEDVKPGAGDGRGFVDALRPGDRVGIWARAMFPGWANCVSSVEVDISVIVD